MTSNGRRRAVVGSLLLAQLAIGALALDVLGTGALSITKLFWSTIGAFVFIGAVSAVLVRRWRMGPRWGVLASAVF